MMRRGLVQAFYRLAFLLTGVGTALLGATLPAVLHRYHLSDLAGGNLLLASWAGSTFGALLAKGRLRRTAALGMLLTGLALVTLAAAHHLAPTVLYLVYGVGLGVAMTAISLLSSQGSSTQDAALELNRLNLLWAAGACLAPILAAHTLRRLSPDALYGLLGILFAAAAVLLEVLPDLRSNSERPTIAAKTQPSLLPRVPLRYCLFAAASVGLESALGSWLTTYAGRMSSSATVGLEVSVTFAFWTGLLLSRATHAVRRLYWLHTTLSRNLHLLAVALGVGFLLLSAHPVLTMVAGLLCGVGLGPLYPYVLSQSLPRFRSTAVFVFAGVGASFVPWLTGLLSSHFGTLRMGLLAPAVGVFVLFAIEAVPLQDHAVNSSIKLSSH